MPTFSLHQSESADAARVTESIQRSASKGAVLHGMSDEEFVGRLHTAVNYAISQQESPVEDSQDLKRFDALGALAEVGITKQMDIAVAPLVRLLHIRIIEMKEQGE